MDGSQKLPQRMLDSFAGILLIAILIWRWAWRDALRRRVDELGQGASTLTIRCAGYSSARGQTVKKAPVVLRRCWDMAEIFGNDLRRRRRGLRKSAEAYDGY